MKLCFLLLELNVVFFVLMVERKLFCLIRFSEEGRKKGKFEGLKKCGLYGW